MHRPYPDLFLPSPFRGGAGGGVLKPLPSSPARLAIIATLRTALLNRAKKPIRLLDSSGGWKPLLPKGRQRVELPKSLADERKMPPAEIL